MKHIIATLAVLATVGCASAPRNDASVHASVGPDEVVYHVNDSAAQASTAIRNINNHLET
jgi:hypothetical protein